MTTELVLLGTAGGPIPRGERHAPAQVIVVDGYAYLIDCGNSVAHQLQQAGVPFSALRAVFITHQHSDHNADIGNLFLLGWPGLRNQVRVIGPPPLKKIMACFMEMQEYDIRTRTADEQRPPLAEFIAPEEITQGGVIYEDELVTVSAAVVDHPPVEPSFAYRFDSRDRSIVISGDTRPSDALVGLATGADVLVHEAIYLPAIGALQDGNNGAALARHLERSHTPVEQVGAIAERAEVSQLVLSHLTPSSTIVSDAQWREEAQRGFSGTVLVGKDLMRI